MLGFEKIRKFARFTKFLRETPRLSQRVLKDIFLKRRVNEVAGIMLELAQENSRESDAGSLVPITLEKSRSRTRQKLLREQLVAKAPDYDFRHDMSVGHTEYFVKEKA